MWLKKGKRDDNFSVLRKIKNKKTCTEIEDKFLVEDNHWGFRILKITLARYNGRITCLFGVLITNFSIQLYYVSQILII